MSDPIERVPPQSRDAEQSVLGSMLVDRDAIPKVIEILSAEDFYFPAHRDIYESVQDLYVNNKPVDMVTVGEWLRAHEALEKIGGISYLADLAGTIPITANVDAYARIVQEKSLLRKLIQAGQQVVTLGYEEDQSVDTILDQAEKIIFAIGQRRGNKDLVHIQKIIAETFGNWDEMGEDVSQQQVPSAYVDLDAVLGGGMGRSDLIILAARPAMGKCASFDTLITLADGSVETIEELYRRQAATLLTLDTDWKLKYTEPSAYIDDGIKPVFKVTTRLGRTIETTITHPYLTMAGWQPLGSLEPGVHIAVPRRLAVFGQEVMRPCEVKLLAYLIGDGCLTDNTPEFTNSNPLVLDDFSAAAEEFGGLERRLEECSDRTPTICLSGSREQAVVPAPVFRLTKPQLALFLNRLFATDGWASVLASGQAQLGYATISERLARQVQHLLLRFGVIAALRKREVKYKDTRRPAWQLDITDAVSIKTFIGEIGIFGKEQALDAVLATLEDRKYHTNRDVVPAEVWDYIATSKGSESWAGLARRAGIQGHSNMHVGQRALSRGRLATLATALTDGPLLDLAQSDVYWDEIVSIEYTGDHQVYDLTIPETHNFVANDICVHNTALCLNIAAKVAMTRQLPVAIFSLEMSKEQLMQRMLCLHGRLSSLRLRSRNMSAEEFKQVNQAAAELSTAPIYIDDSSTVSAMEIRAKARRLKAEVGDLGLLVIDYLQLMESHSGGRSDNRVQEVSAITRSLKQLARELRVPVIALSQLSRKVEERTDKRPMLSDLRESGSIEQDSDVVLFIYRDDYYHPSDQQTNLKPTELIVAKHRNGPTGKVFLMYQADYTRFENASREGIHY